MARYDRFIDTVCALVFVALLITNAWIIGIFSTAVVHGLLLAVLLFGSGAGMALMFSYYSGLAKKDKEKPQG